MKRFALVTAAALLALTGCATQPPPVSEKVQQYYDNNVANAQATLPATKGATATTTVSIISDSHAFNADSWWRQTVVANKVPRLTAGAFESQPGAMASSLLPRLDAATARKGKVIVQAGTNDLIGGSTPADAAAAVEKLWQGVKDRGSVPVVALVPPSDRYGAEVIELNAILSRAASQQNLAIIDVYTPVADQDGTWADGLSTDGVHANKAGSDKMAAAAMQQLPPLAG